MDTITKEHELLTKTLSGKTTGAFKVYSFSRSMPDELPKIEGTYKTYGQARSRAHKVEEAGLDRAAYVCLT